MRYQDWPVRLDHYLNSVKDKPFKRGAHDCAMFAVNCANIIRSDVDDFGKEFRRPYKNKKEAYELLKKKGFENLDQVAVSKLGIPYASPLMAQRGDCVTVPCAEGIALAIVDLSGKRAVTTGKKGLEYYPMNQWINGWQI